MMQREALRVVFVVVVFNYSVLIVLSGEFFFFVLIYLFVVV